MQKKSLRSMRMSAKVWYFFVYLIYFVFYVNENAILKWMHEIDNLVPEVNDTFKTLNFIDKMPSFLELLSGCKAFNNTPGFFKGGFLLKSTRFIGISFAGYYTMQKYDDRDIGGTVKIQTIERINSDPLLTIIKYRRLKGNVSNEINPKSMKGCLPMKEQLTSIRDLSPIVPTSTELDHLEFLVVDYKHFHPVNESLDSDHNNVVFELTMVFHVEEDLLRRGVTMNFKKQERYTIIIIIDESTNDACNGELFRIYSNDRMNIATNLNEKAPVMTPPIMHMALQFYLRAISFMIANRGKISLMFTFT